MLRSNSKEAIVRLGDYLQKNETGWEKDPATAEEAAGLLALFFHQYLGSGTFKLYELRRCGSYQEAFIDWMRGLPCSVASDIFYHSEARQILGDILKETEAERNKYSEERAEWVLCSLIWIHYVSKKYFAIAGGR